MRRTIKTIARRAVAPEVKYVGNDILDSMFNSSISSGSECYPVMPLVTQGDGDHQRVGDKIKGRYLYVKGYVTYDQTTVASGQSGGPNHPIVARLLILSQKNIKSNNLVQANVRVGNLLDDRIGTDATRSFTGANSYDITAPINKDLFVVHYDKKIRLSPQGLAGAGNSDALWTQGQKAVYFKAKIKTPNTLTFDDSAFTAGTPTNFAPFMCVGWAYADGEAPPEPNVTPVHVQCQSTVYFTDV